MMFPLLLFQIQLPYLRRWYAVTQHIHGQQAIVRFSQIFLESCNLTGCAGKQHPPPGGQILPHLGICIVKTALHILASPQPPQILFGFYPNMTHLEGIIKGSAEYNAAAF